MLNPASVPTHSREYARVIRIELILGCTRRRIRNARGMTATRIHEILTPLGGVAPISVLTDARLGRRAIEAAVACGNLIRPRRGWVAMPAADPLLLAAARTNTVLTCVTRAAQLDLWVHEASAGHTHIAPLANNQKFERDKVVAHWSKPIVPRHPMSLVDQLENVLARVAECQPFEHALATWESALNKRLVTREALHRLPFGRRAKRILERAQPFADSGLETYVRERLRFLRLPLRFQIWIHGHHVDLLVGDRLVIQIDGGTHVGAQREQDIQHDAELRLMGYHPFRFGYGHLMHRWHEVQEVIMRAVAQGLHLAR